MAAYYTSKYSGEEIDALLGNAEQLSRPNLLDNWYFADPINQRGKTEYAANAYNIDRFRSNSANINVQIRTGAIRITTLAAISSTWAFFQVVEGADAFIGKSLTISAMAMSVVGSNMRIIISARNSSDGEIGSVSKVITAGVTDVTYSKIPTGTASLRVGVYAYTGASGGDYVDLLAIKLEQGEGQTLARQDSSGNWVLLDPPPNKALELAKCQRYQYVINGYLLVNGVLTSDKTALLVQIPTPVSMRAKPAVSSVTVSGVRTCAGSNVTPVVTAVVVESFTPHSVNLMVSTTTFATDTFTNNTPISAYVRTCILDANL